MFKLAKHIITILLCFLIVGGSVGVHFYIFKCSGKDCTTQLALNKDISCACSAAGVDEHQHGGSHEGCCARHSHQAEQQAESSDAVSVSPLSCGNSDVQVFQLSQFEVQQERVQGTLLLPVIQLVQTMQSCSTGFLCSACQRVVQHDFSQPNTLSGKTILLLCSLLRL
ncbi:MAG: hypothetical protein LBK47_02285 [Prevotellaceae bacterium]|jgi:hypothetical protein|nr:hypothetical protein [Prevotellaceae bacterium]